MNKIIRYTIAVLLVPVYVVVSLIEVLECRYLVGKLTSKEKLAS
jgi:hypothetical protein